MRIRHVLIGLALAFAACGGGGKKGDTTTTTTTSSEKSLYDRLGGKDAISAVVDTFVANVAADTRINAMFANADIPNLKAKLVDQICQATGGPCTYTGKNMKDAHTGMNIKEADFTALVEDLKKALAQYNVPEKEQSELLGALATMKGDIVTAK
jgi:hemoglobin